MRPSKYCNCRLAIKVRAFLRDAPFASTVAAIVKNEDIGVDAVVEKLDIQQAITDVSGVAVKPNKSGAGILMRNKPSM